MTDDIRPTYTEDLRALADLLDAHPDLPRPFVTAYSSGSVEAHWYLHINDLGHDLPGQKAAAAGIIREIGGHWDKAERDYDDALEFNQARKGLVFQVVVTRDAVCERVVTGTHEVTVPAAPAIPAQAATVERVETVEDVEWICSSLLSPAEVA